MTRRKSDAKAPQNQSHTLVVPTRIVRLEALLYQCNRGVGEEACLLLKFKLVLHCGVIMAGTVIVAVSQKDGSGG